MFSSSEKLRFSILLYFVYRILTKDFNVCMENLNFTFYCKIYNINYLYSHISNNNN